MGNKKQQQAAARAQAQPPQHGVANTEGSTTAINAAFQASSPKWVTVSQSNLDKHLQTAVSKIAASGDKKVHAKQFARVEKAQALPQLLASLSAKRESLAKNYETLNEVQHNPNKTKQEQKQARADKRAARKALRHVEKAIDALVKRGVKHVAAVKPSSQRPEHKEGWSHPTVQVEKTGLAVSSAQLHATLGPALSGEEPKSGAKWVKAKHPGEPTKMDAHTYLVSVRKMDAEEAKVKQFDYVGRTMYFDVLDFEDPESGKMVSLPDGMIEFFSDELNQLLDGIKAGTASWKDFAHESVDAREVLFEQLKSLQCQVRDQLIADGITSREARLQDPDYKRVVGQTRELKQALKEMRADNDQDQSASSAPALSGG